MRLENLDRFDWVLDTARDWLEAGESLDLTILCGDNRNRNKLKCHKLMLQQFLHHYSGQRILTEVDLVILPEFNIEEVQDYLALIYGFRDQEEEEATPNTAEVKTDHGLDGKGIKVETEQPEVEEESHDTDAKNEEGEYDKGFEVHVEEEEDNENVDKKQNFIILHKDSSEEEKDSEYDKFEENNSDEKEDSEAYKPYSGMIERCPDKIKYCHICGETFQFSRLAYLHMISKHDPQELVERKLTYKDHGRIGVKMIKCEMEFCDQFFDDKRRMKLHVKGRHQGKSCKVCSKLFPSYNLLNAHMKSEHPEKGKGNKMELCSECGENVSKSAMTLHILYKHKKDISTKEFKYFCSFCDYKCRNSNSLIGHIRLHTGEKPEVCTFCGKAFRVKRTRDNHERLHTNERPYSCNHCEERFVQRTSLTSHLKSRHKDKLF